MTLCPCVTAFLDAQYENAKCCAVARCAHVYSLCLCEKEWRRGGWHFSRPFPNSEVFCKKRVHLYMENRRFLVIFAAVK